MDDNTNSRLKSCGISVSDILLPKKGIDLKKWAVVACDQFTSEPEYWEKADKFVSESPSTLRITYPEVYLGKCDNEKKIAEINGAMRNYVKEGIFTTYWDSAVLVERKTETGTRFGLMLSLDLEAYSYAPNSKTLVRATEGTILSRIPPRKEIRKNASLELPHIMVLISDEKKTVIEPLVEKREKLEKIYDTELMLDGGHLIGYLVNSNEDLSNLATAIETLKKNLDPENPLLYAMGDGNHSLATAKSCWEDIKQHITPEEQKYHRARYALVEIENIFDPALQFEPIHRVFFNTDIKDFNKEAEKLAKSIKVEKVTSTKEILSKINMKGSLQSFGLITEDGYCVYSLEEPKYSTAAKTMQEIIDTLIEQKKGEIDYIHGVDVTEKLGKEKNNIGIILPDVSKETFFEAIIKDKAFPRKTFSIGHAHEKRYYMEARKIN
ncbi:MAG: DUF1015 domain-containing protein [Sphaerochaetaceae bacterium]|nr:DUF1015 domain-containing protein [Sphaerochaetaceae bacterium]